MSLEHSSVKTRFYLLVSSVKTPFYLLVTGYHFSINLLAVNPECNSDREFYVKMVNPESHSGAGLVSH